MDSLHEKTWKEFYDHPGIIEAMDEVYKKTGWTIKIWYDDQTGEVIKVAPVRKE